MPSLNSVYIGIALIFGAIGYYTYTQYVIDKQKIAIERLEIAKEVDTANDNVKAVQGKLDTIKEVHDAIKDIKVDVNTTTGKHTLIL